MQLTLAALALALVCHATIQNAEAASYTALTSHSTDQVNPRVNGTTVVWEDWRNNSALTYPNCERDGLDPSDTTYGFGCRSDIYIYNLAYPLVAPTALDPGLHAAQLRPDIAGNKVVWEDFRNVSPDAENCPVETGCNFESTPNIDIYGVGLDSTSKPVASTLERQHAASDARQSRPTVGKVTVGGVERYLSVWEDYTDDWNRMVEPAPTPPYGDLVIGVDSVNSNLFGAISTTGHSVSAQIDRIAGLTTPWDRGRQTNMSIYGNYLVWEDHRLSDGVTSDIWMYNLATDTDHDGVPDFRETDLDGDGIPNVIDSDIDGDADDDGNKSNSLSKCNPAFLASSVSAFSRGTIVSSTTTTVTVAGANWDGNDEVEPPVPAKVMSGSINGTEGGYFVVDVTSDTGFQRRQLIDHDNDTITVSPAFSTAPAAGSSIDVYRRVLSSRGGDKMNGADLDCDGVHDGSDPNIDGDFFSNADDIDDDDDGYLDDDDNDGLIDGAFDDAFMGNPFQYSSLLTLGFSNPNGFVMDSTPHGSAEKNLTLTKRDKRYAENPDIYNTRMVYQADPGDDSGPTGVSDIWYVGSISLPSSQTRLTNTPDDDERNPAIYGDWIVYEDDSAGNYDLVAYNVVNQLRFRLTSDSADQKNPDIYADKIVYENRDTLTGQSDIYLTKLPKVVFTPVRTIIPYSTTAGFRGTVKSFSGAAVSGVTVSLKRGSTVVDTDTTTSTGTFLLGAKHYAASAYSFSFAGDKGYSPMISGASTVKLGHYVTLGLSASSVKYGTATKLTGRVGPNRAGKSVYIQKYNAGTRKWVDYKTLTLSSSSTYTYTRKFGKGSHKFRVKFPAQSGVSIGYSPIKYLTVK